MKFKVPEGVASLSVGGIEYRVSGGMVDVPAEHAAELAFHDCMPVPVEPAAVSPRGRKSKV